MTAAPDGRRLFVYYRVPVAEVPRAVSAVREFQACLRMRYPSLGAMLLRRPEPRDGCLTLMEAYTAAGGIDDAIVAAIQRSAADAGLPQPRHVEVFELLG